MARLLIAKNDLCGSCAARNVGYRGESVAFAKPTGSVVLNFLRHSQADLVLKSQRYARLAEKSDRPSCTLKHSLKFVQVH